MEQIDVFFRPVPPKLTEKKVSTHHNHHRHHNRHRNYHKYHNHHRLNRHHGNHHHPLNHHHHPHKHYLRDHHSNRHWSSSFGRSVDITDKESGSLMGTVISVISTDLPNELVEPSSPD